MMPKGYPIRRKPLPVGNCEYPQVRGGIAFIRYTSAMKVCRKHAERSPSLDTNAVSDESYESRIQTFPVDNVAFPQVSDTFAFVRHALDIHTLPKARRKGRP